ncbi:LysR family transcriptional regulator [Pseudonocardia sp. RS11V-5]|uniref:LysR family transcriptional regulator n=1 Tax=Pseudonocardia terrae TaxID=2905831 RepID=UPI001E30E397|nr:LysR family transcriptional regulator [Pseudonocardia terrae]MCE3555929.1 LysR family transcriptional regulator [Pseudonocardia terrae]
MQLHQVRYFLAVVEHGGVNAAATALGVAQPTVSQGVRELEKELGIPLFHRIGRGLVLSSAGHAFTGPARRLVRDVVAASGALPDAAGYLQGRLDIHVHAGLAVDPVSRLVGSFRARHPRVSIRMGVLRDGQAAGVLVREGHCEIAVGHLPFSDDHGLSVAEIGVYETWLIFPEGTELPPDDPLPLSAIPDIPLVVVPRGGLLPGQIERALSEAGRLRSPAAVVEHREARLPFVLAGIGATFVERAVALSWAARGLVARAVDPPIRNPFGVIFDPKTTSPAGREFLRVAGVRSE